MATDTIYDQIYFYYFAQLKPNFNFGGILSTIEKSSSFLILFDTRKNNNDSLLYIENSKQQVTENR